MLFQVTAALPMTAAALCSVRQAVFALCPGGWRGKYTGCPSSELKKGAVFIGKHSLTLNTELQSLLVMRRAACQAVKSKTCTKDCSAGVRCK